MGKGRTWRQRRRSKWLLQKKGGNGKETFLCQAEYVHLRKWMKAEGNFKSPHLIPYIFPETGRGLMTLKQLKPGDHILSVSDKLIITSDTVLASDIGHWIKKCEPPLSAHQALAVFLLSERTKGRHSFWYPYLRLLPDTFDTPAFWSAHILNNLPPAALAYARTSLENVRAAHVHVCTWCNLVCPHLAPQLVSEKNFFWAWYAVNSRCVYMEVPSSAFIQERNKNYALVPFLDLLNHSSDAKVSAGFNSATKSFEIVTCSGSRKYEQVFIKYGCHNNMELLIEYGFTIPQNPSNVYEFSLDDILIIAKNLNVTHLVQKEKIFLSNQFETGLNCIDDDVFFSWKLLAVIHILSLSWPKLQNWKSSVSTVSLPCLRGESKHLAMHLVQLTIENLQQHQSQNGKESTISCDKNHFSFHKKLCMNLWRDDFTILRKAQQILTQMT